MLTLKQNVNLTPFQGHIILYCKLHYGVDDVSFIDGFKRLWIAKCKEDGSDDMLDYIANYLFEIICTVSDFDAVEFQSRLHLSLFEYNPKKKSAIELIISFYIFQLSNLKTSEYDSISGKIKMLLTLPNPKKRVFNKIISGKGDYIDYKLLTV